MLTRYDEMLCHQIVSTFDRVDTSTREWTEKYWMNVHDRNGIIENLILSSFAKYGF